MGVFVSNNDLYLMETFKQATTATGAIDNNPF